MLDLAGKWWRCWMCPAPAKRLNLGITLAYADDKLRRAEAEWGNAGGAQDYFAAYAVSVRNTGP